MRAWLAAIPEDAARILLDIAAGGIPGQGRRACNFSMQSLSR
jgi:hypothetical protein